MRLAIKITGLKIPELNGIKINPLLSEILNRDYDLDSISEKEFNFLSDLFNETLESLGNFSFSKNRILDTWNDDYLNFMLNVLKQNIFQIILNDNKNINQKNLLITSSLDEEKLFLFS